MSTHRRKTELPTPKGLSKQEVMMTVSDQYLEEFDEVVKRCVQIGFQVNQQLPTIGVMIGLIDAQKIVTLKQMVEIANVEITQSYQIAPPDSDVQ